LDVAEERTIEQILKGLTDTQLRFVQHALFANSKKEAAELAGLNIDYVYTWGPDVDEAVRLARMDALTVAREKLQRIASQAIDVIADEMTARKGTSKRLDSAIAALDRAGMSPKNNVTLAGVLQIIKGYELISPDDWDSGKPRVTIAPPKPAEITDGSYIVVEPEPAAADVMSNDYVASDTA
jgi:hypothetical protein